MIQENYNVIGVMSGTSLDGVDVAHIQLATANNKWTYIIKEAETIAYSEEWLKRLTSAVDFSTGELEELNKEYTLLLGAIIKSFISRYNLKNIDAICSHGHTILHQPQNAFTL